MITRSNIAEVFNLLRESECIAVYESTADYIKIELHVTNTGGTSTIEAIDYDEKNEGETIDDGNLYIDFQTFCELIVSSGTTNKVLIELFVN